MTIGEAILQGLGVNIAATSSSSSSAISATPQITPSPSSATSNASTTLLTGNYTVSFGNQTVYGTENPFEPVKWLSDGPEIASARQCFSTLTSFELASADFYTASIQNKAWPIVTITASTSYTYSTETTIYPANPSTYKLCDGSPRVDIKPETSTYNTTVGGGTYATTVTATPTAGVPRPCNATAETCYEWFRYSNLTTDFAESNTTDSQYLLPNCGFPAHYASDTDNVTNWPCLIAGGPVQLYYFPVDTGNNTTQGLCNGTRTTIPQSPTTPPPSVVTNGYTLTSGSVYVSFSTLFAYYDGFAGYQFGTTFSNILLPFASSEISTGCGGFGGEANAATALNYADFNYPVPASAYACAQRCHQQFYTSLPPGCNTIWDDFNPQMEIPTRLTDLHPAWKTCKSYDKGLVNEWLFDPPIALTQQSSVNGVTEPGGYTYVPAQGTGDPSSGNNVPTRPAGAIPTWPAQTSAEASPAYDSLGSVGPSQTQGPTVYAAGTWTLTASPISGVPNALVIDGHTMSEGGPAWTTDGRTVTWGSSGLEELGSSSQEQVFSVVSGAQSTSQTKAASSGESTTMAPPKSTTPSSRSSPGAMGAGTTSTSSAGKVDSAALVASAMVAMMIVVLAL